jgi:DNA-binding transcriptional LysR family regulator
MPGQRDPSTATAYPSVNTVAQALALHLSNLNLQLQRLETDIGGTLLHGATNHRPMRLTERGHQLLALLDEPSVRRLLNQYAKTRP